MKPIALLACNTDRVDARVLADLARHDLIPDVWVPSVDERANREPQAPLREQPEGAVDG